MSKMIEALVFRYDPGQDFKPRYEKFEIPYTEGMAVLEVLKYINDHYTPIAFRYSCRIKVCGSCAVLMNKVPVLACSEKAQMNMTIEPLPGFPVIKDLVIDLDSYNEKRHRIRPFIERTKAPEEMPRSLSYETVQKYRECDICTKCLICDAVCPVVQESPQKFTGPSLMIETARFLYDPQDEGCRTLIAESEGLFNCDLCGKCTEVCPAEIKIHEVLEDLQKLAHESKG